MNKKKVIVGLTGPTGSGKSTVARQLDSLGMDVIDCDSVAHQVTEEKECLLRLVEAFGEIILDPEKKLNRKKLASLVFTNKEALKLLNQITLPLIRTQIESLIEQSISRFVLLDAPTLFESGMASICDYIVTVTADERFRLSRIMERDQLSEEDALARIHAQKDEFFYSSRSHLSILNQGNETALSTKSNHLFHYLSHITRGED